MDRALTVAPLSGQFAWRALSEAPAEAVLDGPIEAAGAERRRSTNRR